MSMPWWKQILPKRSNESALNAELRFHLDALIERKINDGIPADEARRQAIVEFGKQQQLKEELQDVQGFAMLENIFANLKYAVRFVRKSPSFSVAVVLTLALGIGANTAVFSAIDAVLLRPLPFPNADRLTVLHEYKKKLKTPESFVAPVRLEDWNRLNSTFQAISGYYEDDATDTSGSLPEKITVAMVAPRFLQVMGVSPALGRDFAPEEERYGGPAAVLISDRYWRHQLQADPKAIGKRLRHGKSYPVVVGVMPASFHFPDRNVDLWLPVAPYGPYTNDRSATWYTTVGRLKPGVDMSEGRANLAAVQGQLGKQYPKTDADMTVKVESLKETTINGLGRSLWMLFGSVSLLLLIACINVAALLLARTIQRKREISVRFALGASRLTIIAQLLTESLVLAITGALAGLFVAWTSIKTFRSLAKSLPRVEEIALDWRILLYTLGCAVLTALICGLLPALHATRRSIAQDLAHTSRTQVSNRNRLQWSLVGAQVALAVTLLIGAGLLLRSFQALGQVSPGFDSSHVLTFHITGSYAETVDMKKLQARIGRTLDVIRALPGVEAAATAATLPGVPGNYQSEFAMAEGKIDPARKIIADNRAVSSGYFAAMRIPVLAGSVCQEGREGIAVNHSFVNTYLGGSTAIGYHLTVSPNPFHSPPGEIRGVVADAREANLKEEPMPTVYSCLNAPGPDPNYLVRTHGEPPAMAHAIRLKVHEVEPSRSVFDVSTLQEHIGESFAETRLRTVLLTFFAGTALLLACIGLYGTLNYFVTIRKREIGLRLALGASPGNIIRQFVSKGLGVAVLGSIAGLALAWAFTRVLSGMLYGVSQTDAVTFSSVVLILLVVAAFASFLPAARASHIDPMQVLREE